MRKLELVFALFRRGREERGKRRKEKEKFFDIDHLLARTI